MSTSVILRHLPVLVSLLGMLWVAFPQPLSAHGGGTPRLTNAEAGPYRVYAWSEPDPWRVGEVHLSLAVTKVNTDTTANAPVELPVKDADVMVTFAPATGDGAPITIQAAPATLLTNNYFEAITNLPSEGEWAMTIAVDGPEGSGTTDFTLEALPQRAINWLWVGGVGVITLLIAVTAFWSSRQQPAPSSRPKRPGQHRKLPERKAARAARAGRRKH
jgi:hypothetical protein